MKINIEPVEASTEPHYVSVGLNLFKFKVAWLIFKLLKFKWD